MRYKLNPESIDPDQIQLVRGELEQTLQLDSWLPDYGRKIKKENH